MIGRLLRLALLGRGYGEARSYQEWQAFLYVTDSPKNTVAAHRLAKHPRTARWLIGLAERLA